MKFIQQINIHLFLISKTKSDPILQTAPPRHAGTDTFQSFIIKKLDFFISLKSVSSAIFFINFGKTVNLSFNELIGVNSLCSIYF